ncbi:ABC transporter ATP-binding protein/permease [Pseudonocardia sp.]|uniref:ABC transporter ATP-binding protein/permease n=1 Tax=Pseudonocardia sp. TaxID=60912 RepID=UPI003D14D070
MGPIDWGSEWLTSLLWIFEVTAYVLIGFVVVAWMLVTRTNWGRQFWRISGAYFTLDRRDPSTWRPLLLVALLLLLTVASVRLDVVLSYSSNGLYTALQQLDPESFWLYVGIFCVLATIHVVLSLVTFYFAQRQILQWREWVNERMLDDWLAGTAYHRGRFVKDPVDNPDQRIQEDITSFANVSQSLALGAVSSMVALVSFTFILWELSGPLTMLGVEIPRAMVFIAYIYVIIATVIAFRIGKPLIRLNFLQERLSAIYRYSLIRLRENSENVAFYRGERVENAGLMSRFANVIANAWAIVFRSLKFQGWNLAVSQVAVIFPLIIQAPRFFAQQITLGDVTQTATAFGQVQAALSFFRTAYDDFASYRAVLIRLTGLLDADEQARALPGADVTESDDGLGIDSLTVNRPDGAPMISDLDLTVPSGSSLLVKGPSGSGKTTLLRTLAGLWPNATGTIAKPRDAVPLFLPQQPYLPLGTLRAALAYPDPAGELDDDAARAMLRDVALPHLVDRLDEERDWARTLSPGEQQRLGFGRVLLTEPTVLFLDEASSALDEGMERTMYDLVRDRLPETTIVSVGHRTTLEAMHDQQLALLGEGRWEASAMTH